MLQAWASISIPISFSNPVERSKPTPRGPCCQGASLKSEEESRQVVPKSWSSARVGTRALAGESCEIRVISPEVAVSP